MNIQKEIISAEEILYRELHAFLPQHLDEDVRRKRVKAIRIAAIRNQTEAMYQYGLYVLSKDIKKNKWTGVKHSSGWHWIYKAAGTGCMAAKHFLDQVCKERYEKAFPVSGGSQTDGPLRDFDGKEIRICRTGLRTPVDAVLSFENGENILTLTADLCFLDDEVYTDAKDAEVFRNAVIDGIREWEGVYEVFGGQRVRICMQLSCGENMFDTVNIMPIGKEQEADALKLAEKSPWGDPDRIVNAAALTAFGIRRWKVTSRKYIFFRNPERIVKNPEYIKHIAKHEFGHVIGLGDLYQSEVFKLEGADSANIPELQSYEILPKQFNLVMSNAFGPISNNDVEMVILAFSENRMQFYQPDKVNKYVSRALGRGN